MIVIFVPRAWSKRQYLSYAIFVVVVVFADWSFTLATTGENIKAESVSVYEDAELLRLRGNIEKSEAIIENLHQQYHEAQRRETMTELNAQIEAETARRDKYENEYKIQLEVIMKKAEKNNLVADDIFNAIPSAIKNRRYIPLVIWFFVFVGVQLVVATSIDNRDTAIEPAPVPKKNTRFTDEEIKIFVHTGWYNVSTQGTNIILSPESFFNLQPGFNMKRYEELRKAAIKERIIDQFNHALVVDEAEAERRLKEC